MGHRRYRSESLNFRNANGKITKEKNILQSEGDTLVGDLVSRYHRPGRRHEVVRRMHPPFSAERDTHEPMTLRVQHVVR